MFTANQYDLVRHPSLPSELLTVECVDGAHAHCSWFDQHARPHQHYFLLRELVLILASQHSIVEIDQ